MNARKVLKLTLSALLICGFIASSVNWSRAEAADVAATRSDVGARNVADPAAPTANTDDEIIYLDNSGCIKVKDTNQISSNHQLITFDSAQFGDCGWSDIATGDFNNDGDAEIVAVGSFAGSGKLTIFDPVYRGADPEGSINQVPWKRIYTMSKSGSPITVVGAGNMNANVPGDEIFIGYTVNEPNNITYRIEVLIATNTGGTSWTSHINKSFGGAWESVRVGNINNSGSDDVVLIRNIPFGAETSSLIEAHQIDNDFALIWSNGGTDRQWNSAAIGQVYAGGTGEVVAVRQFAGFAPSASFFIFGYSNGTLKEADGDALAFYPYPRYAFVADINGNGDDEAFFIRSLPSDVSSPRLVMRNRGNDSLPTFELTLDADNGYYQGFGADVDADGKEEVILLRSENLRIYQSPDVNQLYDLIPISAKAPGTVADTKNSILAVGNLDGTGYTSGARLTVTPNVLVHTLQSGLSDSAWIELAVTNTGTTTPINFGVTPPSSSWILDFAYDGTATPAKMYIKFKATDLMPGQYLGPSITLKTTDPNVLNPTVVVPIVLNVTPASISVTPSRVSGVYLPGQDTSKPISRTLTLVGTPGVTYSAGFVSTSTLRAAQAAFDSAIVGGYADETGQLVLKDAMGYIYNTGVAAFTAESINAADITWPSGLPWVGATSVDATLSDTMTVGVYGNKLTKNYESAVLVIVADARAGDYPDNVRFVDVEGMVATNVIMLPFIQR